MKQDWEQVRAVWEEQEVWELLKGQSCYSFQKSLSCCYTLPLLRAVPGQMKCDKIAELLPAWTLSNW